MSGLGDDARTACRVTDCPYPAKTARLPFCPMHSSLLAGTHIAAIRDAADPEERGIAIGEALSHLRAAEIKLHSRLLANSVAAIIEDAVELTGFTPSQILGAQRARPIAYVRFAIAHVARRNTGQSLPEIGRRLGRDHTTILNGLARAKGLVDKDANFAWLVNELEQRAIRRRAVAEQSA